MKIKNVLEKNLNDFEAHEESKCKGWRGAAQKKKNFWVLETVDDGRRLWLLRIYRLYRKLTQRLLTPEVSETASQQSLDDLSSSSYPSGFSVSYTLWSSRGGGGRGVSSVKTKKKETV